MKAAWSVMVSLVAICALVLVAQADEKKEDKKKDKEVTLKGTILCAKCELEKTKECTTAIKVKEDGKDVVYYLDDKGNKEKYHKDICKKTKKGSVKGTVSEKDGQKYIKPSKDGVKFDDKEDK